ncbi:MAG: hypothetical protein J0I11_08030 [Actinobacteria bacterium]|nr:hypothetical protein [Actinomycetota bacterium]
MWPQTAAAAQIPAILLSGLAAAAAAWSVTATTRFGMTEQMRAMVVPGWRRELPFALVVTGYFAGVILLCQVVAAVPTARTWPPGFGLVPGYVVMALVVIVLSVAFGHLVGKLLSGMFAAAVAGLAWLLIAMYLGQMIGLGVVSGPVWDEIDLPIVLARLLFAVALLALAIVIPPRSRARADGGWRRKGATWFGATALAATVLLLGVTVAAGSPIKARPPVATDECAGVTVKLCLWPEHAKYLPQIEAMAARLDQMPDSLEVPARIDEYGLTYRPGVPGQTVFTDVPDHPPYFALVEGSMWSVAVSIADIIGRKNIHPCTAPGTSKSDDEYLRAVEFVAWVEAYLVGGTGGPDYHTSAGADRQAAAARGVARAHHGTAEEQFAWALKTKNAFNDAPCQ